jgi:hypothetical protein
LRELLQNPFVTNGDYLCPNRFVLYSDRGDAGLDVEDYFVEFCGGQPFNLGSKLTINAATQSPKRITVETFDIVTMMLQEHTTAAWVEEIIATVGVEAAERHNLIATMTNRYFVESFARKDDRSFFYIYLYPILECFGSVLRAALEPHLSVLLRGDDTPPVITQDGDILDAVELYKQVTTDNLHVEGAVTTSLYIVGLVTNTHTTLPADDNYIGGMFVPNNGGASYLEYATLYDLLGDVAKCFWLKLRWTYSRYNITGGSDNEGITFKFHWTRRLENYNGAAFYTADTGRAIGDGYELESCYNVVRTGEAEIPDAGENDVDKRIVETGGLRNSATWNVKCLHQNHPEITDKSTASSIMNTPAINSRLLYYYDGSAAIKAHESVKIYDSAASSIAYSDVIPLPPYKKVDEYNLWVAETQAAETGLAYATAAHAVAAFGKTNQSKLEITLAMNPDEGLIPENCGEMFNLPAIAGEVSSTEWCLLEAEPDWLTGSMKCVFISKGI